MLNLRFGIPLFLLIAHQHVSNSVFGINNAWVSIALFLLFIASMCFFLLSNNNLGYSKIAAVLSLLLSIALWLALPGIFKDISALYINLFITYYIVSQGGFQVMKNQLSLLVLISALLSIVQIWGITPIVHLWNSQYVDERAGQMVKNIELNNIMRPEFLNADWFDSRQVRASGIFHSSALLGGIYVMYITFIFCGYYKSLSNYAFIPFLCVFSGSKLVLAATLILIILALLFRRMSWRMLLLLTIGSVLTVSLHRFLFHSLIDFQFNTELLFFSIDVRLQQYSWESIDFVAYVPYIIMIIGLALGIFFVNKVFNIWSNSDKIFHYTVLTIAVIASFFSTPHIGNLLFGWFYFPAFLCFRYANENRRVNAIPAKSNPKGAGLPSIY